MPANKTEQFITASVKRAEILEAPYNPRRISKDAEKKLRKFMRENGSLQPLVWNKATGHLVAGHQRLKAMDAIMRKKDYEVSVAVVEMDKEKEVKANVFLNNPSAMGEFDVDALIELAEEFPDIDFKADFAFDQAELEIMFAGTEAFEDIAGAIDPETPDERTELERMQEIDKLKEAKRGYRDEQREANATGTTHQVDQDDYMITFVFNNNQEKHDFMHRVQKPPGEKFLKSSVLVDINTGRFKLTGAVE